MKEGFPGALITLSSSSSSCFCLFGRLEGERKRKEERGVTGEMTEDVLYSGCEVVGFVFVGDEGLLHSWCNKRGGCHSKMFCSCHVC